MRDRSRDLLAAASGVLLFVLCVGAGQLILTSAGIEFSDQTVQTTAGPELVDSQGLTMGTVLGYEQSDDSVQALLRLGDPVQSIFFRIESRNRYIIPNNLRCTVSFTGENCTGDAYVTNCFQWSYPVAQDRRWAFAGPGELYAATGPDLTFDFPSRWTSPISWWVGDLSDMCQNNPDWPEETGTLATLFLDMKTLPYTTPFDIR